MTTVAIVGHGAVGRALAGRVLAAGCAVRFGARDPEAARAALGPLAGRVEVAPAAGAASGADATLLAVPAGAAVAVAAALPAGSLVVDCTNPVRWDDGPVWAPPAQGSVAAAIAAAAPGLRVVKAFNHFGAEVQAAARVAAGPVDALVAGDDPAARAAVMALAERMGFVARDAGPLRNAALLESLAVLWIHLATQGGMGRRFAFTLAPLPPG